jgi:hypothetical protein
MRTIKESFMDADGFGQWVNASTPETIRELVMQQS